MAEDALHYAPPPLDFDRWLTAVRHAALGHYTRDAILGGLRARLFTDSLMLAEAWADTLFGPQEWQTLIHQSPPTQSAMTLYAAAVKDHQPLMAVSPTQSTAVMINRTECPVLLDALMALAAHKLGEQIGWVARGTCLAVGQHGVLVTGPGHAETAEQIATQAKGQIVLADPVLIRLTLTRQVDGVQLAPMRVLTERGQAITGTRILHWLRREAYQEPRADVFCLSLDQRDEPVMARDLDLDRCAELYAYPLTRTSRLKPLMLTDVLLLTPGLQAAVLSLDARTFAARLASDQPWVPQEVVYEMALTLECHSAGAATPAGQQFQVFIAEIIRRLANG